MLYAGCRVRPASTYGCSPDDRDDWPSRRLVASHRIRRPLARSTASRSSTKRATMAAYTARSSAVIASMRSSTSAGSASGVGWVYRPCVASTETNCPHASASSQSQNAGRASTPAVVAAKRQTDSWLG